ncbi:hypothetical protein GCM10028822_39160 [Hymenobacter terrigena]
MNDILFESLKSFLLQVPAIEGTIGTGIDEGLWWVKFKIDIRHPLAWHVVQEIGHVVNYVSIDERLPTAFYPVSPPPYMNGGPDEFLSWLIENKDPDFTPDLMKTWLEGRLPQPVNDEAQWSTEDEED